MEEYFSDSRVEFETTEGKLVGVTFYPWAQGLDYINNPEPVLILLRKFFERLPLYPRTYAEARATRFTQRVDTKVPA